jgi:hypothetical protein
MRRLLAHLVLLTIVWGYGWGYVAPAALGATEADLPPCCRGNGKHHCAMAMMQRWDGTTLAFRENSPQCPYRLPGPVLNGSAAAETKKTFALELPGSNLLLPIDPAPCASSDQIRNAGRSPPAVLL